MDSAPVNTTTSPYKEPSELPSILILEEDEKAGFTGRLTRTIPSGKTGLHYFFPSEHSRLSTQF